MDMDYIESRLDSALPQLMERMEEASRKGPDQWGFSFANLLSEFADSVTALGYIRNLPNALALQA